MSLKLNVYMSSILLLLCSVFFEQSYETYQGINKFDTNDDVIDCNKKKNERTLNDDDKSCSIKDGNKMNKNEDASVTKQDFFQSTINSSSKSKNQKTIATSKTRGRLGNHLWAYLHLMFVEYTYDIDIVVENEVKNSLTKFFKNFENLKTINDVCGYNEFFSQYRDMIDSLIVRQYEEMSGVKVVLERSGQIAKLHPPEIGLKYGKINAETLADSAEFIDEFKVDYTKFPPGCPYKVYAIFS